MDGLAQTARVESARGILVSGASTGIGRAIAERLAGDGYIVYAGVRDAASAERIAALHANLRPVTLDVTDGSSIAAAFERVRADGVAVAALINNAGIAVGGPLEYLALDELRKQFEVNVVGPIALIQAALPMLRATRGRIISIGSIGGRFGAPFVGPYSASKAALAMLSDALRIELAPAGIGVSLFEFAAVKTPIWEKGRSLSERLSRELPAKAIEQYAPVIDAIVRQTQQEEQHAMDPSIIADAVASVLRAERPRGRYIIGKQARTHAVVAALPHGIREQLIRKAMKLP